MNGIHGYYDPNSGCYVYTQNVVNTYSTASFYIPNAVIQPPTIMHVQTFRVKCEYCGRVGEGYVCDGCGAPMPL